MLHPPHALLPPLAAHADAACRAFTHVGSMCYLKSCAQGRQRLPMDGATSAVRKN